VCYRDLGERMHRSTEALQGLGRPRHRVASVRGGESRRSVRFLGVAERLVGRRPLFAVDLREMDAASIAEEPDAPLFQTAALAGLLTSHPGKLAEQPNFG
jgi:hypothetical protein